VFLSQSQRPSFAPIQNNCSRQLWILKYQIINVYIVILVDLAVNPTMSCRVADHRSDDWFLMGSPWPVVCIAVSYVYFVKILGPRLMKDRPPLNVDPIVRVYNLLQIFLCLYLLYRVSHTSCEMYCTGRTLKTDCLH
jgi:hypothetical protein